MLGYPRLTHELTYAYRHKVTKRWASSTPYRSKGAATQAFIKSLRIYCWPKRPVKEAVEEAMKDWELVTFIRQEHHV